MDKGRLFSGLAVMLGLIIMGSMFPKAVEKFRSYDRTVNVKGLCEKEVKADRVIWPIVYRVMANDIQSVYDQTDSGNATIFAFLEEGGIKATATYIYDNEKRDSTPRFIEVSSSTGRTMSQEVLDVTLDSYGNWIETTIDASGNIMHQTREIEYY